MYVEMYPAPSSCLFYCTLVQELLKTILSMENKLYNHIVDADIH